MGVLLVAVGRDKAVPFPACDGLASNASLMLAYVPCK